jgi:glycosyltransferase involved in cell wall biosynthesis
MAVRCAASDPDLHPGQPARVATLELEAEGSLTVEVDWKEVAGGRTSKTRNYHTLTPVWKPWGSVYAYLHMANILFISTRNINNKYEPRNYTIGALIAGLAELHNVRLMSPGFEPLELALQPKHSRILGGIKSYQLKGSGGVIMLVKIIQCILLFRPFQFCVFDNDGNRQSFLKVLEEFSPDIVIFDYLRAYPFSRWLRLAGTDAVLIMDIGDLLSKRYRSISDQNSFKGDFLGYSKKILPVYLQRLANVVGRCVLWYESAALYRFEMECTLDHNAVVLVSNDEVNELKRRVTPPHNVYHIPFASEINKFSIDLVRNRDVLKGYYIGNFNYYPNVLAVEDVINSVGKIGSKFQLKIIGPNLPGRLCSLVESKNNIEYLGYVDDVFAATSDCGVLVSPVFAGSGVSSKILEAVGRGVFVITNSRGSLPLKSLSLKSIFTIDSDSDCEALLKKIQAVVGSRESIFQHDLGALSSYCSTETVVQRWNELIDSELGK